MIAPLTQQRCLQHPEREAVARCPECTQFFCRECVVEHDDRLLCAACLRKIVRGSGAARARFALAARATRLVLSVLLAWFFFYFAGRLLLSTPASFHEGTVWEQE